ncbi:MAG TPA: glycosyltransferase [Candidatus Limnocylindria bacterium]|jgi:glycosyltransferase involved in cell wall biosynthesis|nr:glycosyltransferase [Candidatus Limnocylindria bacterium]
MARFSIFIPIYNDGRWLAGAIESVLAQSHAEWELVVGDNASTEPIEPIVRRFGDPRIRYHRWQTHARIDENFNRTALLTREPWVQFLGADDRLHPGCLARMATVIDGWAPDGDRLAMVVTACRRVDEQGRSADHIWYGTRPRWQVAAGVYDAAGWFDIHLQDGNPPWNVGSVAVARDVLDESGGFFRPETGLSADVELSLRAAAYGSVAYIDEPLLDFMVRPDADNSFRLWVNRSENDQRTPIEVALLAGLRTHQHRRAVSNAEASRLRAIIARSHLQRAAQHRVLEGGRGRPGSARDIAAALRWSPRAVLSPYHAMYALATLVAPRRLLETAKRRLSPAQEVVDPIGPLPESSPESTAR